MDSFFTYLLRSGACLSLFYGFYWIFLRKETFFVLNRVYLLIAAALSVSLPLIRVTSPFFTTVVTPASITGTESVVILPSPTTINPLSLLLAAYLAGAGFLGIRFLFRLFSLFAVARQCRCERHDGLKVIFCGHNGEPFSFFNLIFIDRSKTPEGDIDRILSHEMVHVRQYHSLDILFTEILSIVQWFNPFVWPYRRSLRETHEYLADRAVIAQGCSLARYQLLIVEQHVGGELFELASSFRTSQIKRRLSMLSKQDSKGLVRLKPLLILPLALMLVLAFAESKTVVKADEALLAPQESAAAAQQNEEELIKKLKQKWAELEDMKQKNGEKIEILKTKLESTSDPDTKTKLKAMLSEEMLKSVELDKTKVNLEMKKAEIALNQTVDAEEKMVLKQRLKELQVVNEEVTKKIEEMKKANGKEKEKETIK